MLQHCFCFCFVLVFWLQGIWDLSYPTSDQRWACSSSVGEEILTTRLPGKFRDPTAFQPFSKKKKELLFLRSNLKILREGLLLTLLGYTSIHSIYQSLLPPGLRIHSMSQSVLPGGRGKSWYVGSGTDHKPNFMSGTSSYRRIFREILGKHAYDYNQLPTSTMMCLIRKPSWSVLPHLSSQPVQSKCCVSSIPWTQKQISARIRDSCSPPTPHLQLGANTLPVAISALRGAELWAICLTDTTLPFTYHTLQDLRALSIWVWQGRNQEKLTFLICSSIYLRLLPWCLRSLKKRTNCLQWRRLEFDPLVRIRHNWATNTYLRLESIIMNLPYGK